MKRRSAILGILGIGMALAFGQAGTGSFFNWETPPVHPVALNPEATRLVVCNLPDNRIEVFDVTSEVPMTMGSVFVGLDPVSARFRTATEVWVANFISDSISIVDLATMRVIATLDTLNEPSDIVFAGSPQRAFVSCAQPSVVQVFDAATRIGVTNLVVDGHRPKAMAASLDGGKVYVAIFESGNASTIIGAGVSLGFPSPTPVDFPTGPHGGQNPPPNRGASFIPAINPDLPATNLPPRVGLIVKKNASGRWMDDNEGDWTTYVSGSNAVFSGRPAGWDLPDRDLAIIDTAALDVSYASGLMNICADVAVNPASGRVSVIGTDALNQLRFEPVLNGIFVRAEIATVSPTAWTNHQVTDLNAHLDYQTNRVAQAEREKSLGDPRGIVWSSDGSRGYVTGMGSDNLIIIGPAGQRIGTHATIALGKGPTGMALDAPRHRLYILNRFDATISVLDTAAETVALTVPFFDPTPTVIKQGRPHLYDTHKSSGLGQAACGSCHVDARFDRLAWDLGDPTGSIKRITNGNFGRFPPGATNHFHPMKGPTTTQTLQDIIGHEPFHWRGDRDGLEQFNTTFTNLQGAATDLTTIEMQEFEDFLSTVRLAPNPFRQFNNTLSTNLPLEGQVALGRGTLKAGSPLPNGNAQSGLAAFRLPGTDGCIHCHTLPVGLGTDLRWTGSQWVSMPVGPGGEHHSAFSAIERSSNLPFKIQQLRNLYDKLGLDLSRTNSRAGFGFFHDGSVDTLTRFVQDGFDFRDDQETADMVAFLLSFTGSDLPPGSTTDPDRPPGLAGKDTHAAVGRQTTTTSPAAVPLIDSMLAIAMQGRVDVVVKGWKDGLSRGWLYNRTNGLFQSDRAAEALLPSDLLALSSAANPLTYTVVPRNSGRRLGVDRDEDGYADRDELDFGSDPANALSLATNRPPALSAITNQLVFGGQTLSFTATAADPDVPPQQLTFSLGTNAPAGANINATNGLFLWTPDVAQVPATNLITVVVTDNGTPNRSDARSFFVTVLGLRVGGLTFATNGVELSWTAIPGQTYRLQYKTNLDDPTWSEWPVTITATNGVVTVTDPAIRSQRFYRLLLNP